MAGELGEDRPAAGAPKGTMATRDEDHLAGSTSVRHQAAPNRTAAGIVSLLELQGRRKGAGVKLD
jgi:hypothetical protein